MTDESGRKRTVYLSRSERRLGMRLFLKFTGFNGLGISFLGESTVTLLAIFFGAGNMELGLISAMIHISGVVLLIVPRMFKGRNVVTVGFWSWMIRGLMCLPYGFLFFMEGRNAVALIMFTYSAFCLSRTAGVAMVNTLQKRLMLSRTRSDQVFRTASSFQGNQILSRFISFLVLSLKNLPELTGLLGLSALGMIFNTGAALTFRKIPNRTRVDHRKGENLLVILKDRLADPLSRRVLILRWISLAQIILFGMAVPFLRRSVGIDSAKVFLYTIAVAGASFISSLSLRPIANRAGSRPLLFFSTIPGILIFLMWTFMPATFQLHVYVIAGFVTMFILNASNLAANRLLIDITPENGAVSFNSMETFVTSVLALILGFSAGYLADLSAGLSDVLPINDYGLVFIPAAIGSLVQVLVTLKIDEPGSMGLLEAARIITNIGNLRTWQAISSLEATEDPVKRMTLVHTVGHSTAPVATSEIGRILAEPLSQQKGELIDALFITKRPELTGYLCGEAADPMAFHREKAIFALGAYPGEQSEAVLIRLLDDPECRIRATAAKSLGLIGCIGQLEKIQGLWKESRGLQERLDYMISLYHLDPRKQYLDDVFGEMVVCGGEKSERTFYTLVSRQFDMTPSLGIFYREEATQYGNGVELLLEESRDTRFHLEQNEKLVDLWRSGGYSLIWNLCQAELEGVEPPEELIPVVQAMMNFNTDPDRGLPDSANGMAALYFTYQILTAGNEP